jgi:chlorobactene glucosyltransferase
LLDNLIGVTIFLLVILAIELSNLVVLQRIERTGKKSGITPKVSVLVPARNEENNIAACIKSVLQQNYTNFELIVLDDGSTDNTLEVTRQVAGKDTKTKILEGKALPVGWTGKNWACHQLFIEAEGDLLLFLDADTRLNNRALHYTVNTIQHEGIDFISTFHRQETVTLAEKLLVPIFQWGVFCFYPLFLAMKTRIPVLAIGIGQFMFFTRQAYEKIGGHAAVKSQITEDKALPKALARQGMKWSLLDGTGSLTTRMYLGFKDTYNGLSKSLFEWFDRNILVFTFIWLWLLVVFWQPLIIFGMSIVDGESTIYTTLATISVILSFTIWSIFYIRFKYPPYLIAFYPVIIVMWVSIAMVSMIRSLSGTTTWKGRTVSKQ